MMSEAVENKLYVYLDRFPDGVKGTYREFEEILGIDHSTIFRVVNESRDITSKSYGTGNSKETLLKLSKYETKRNTIFIPKEDVFDKPIETKEITFNTRQHKLCDYLLEYCLGKERLKDKVDILWDLREFYFANSDDLPWKEDIKKSRHNYAEYVRMTSDISFINKHGRVRQILIGSQGGKNGGIWALRIGEQHDAIDKIFGDGLKKLDIAWAMKKAAEEQAQTRMVFKNEKAIMDIFRQFDN